MSAYVAELLSKLHTSDWSEMTLLEQVTLRKAAENEHVDRSDDLALARAEVARLREALEPFAEMANAHKEKSDVWILNGVWTSPGYISITVSDLRRAAAALRDLHGKEER